MARPKTGAECGEADDIFNCDGDGLHELELVLVVAWELTTCSKCVPAVTYFSHKLNALERSFSRSSAVAQRDFRCLLGAPGTS